MESLIFGFHMARRFLRLRIGKRTEHRGSPDSHTVFTASAEYRRRPGTKRRVGGRRTPRIRSKSYKITPISTPKPKHSTEAVRSLTTNIRIFVRGRVARNPAVLQPGLIGPFVCILRLPRPHNPPTSLFVRDHLSIPRLPQELLVALTERCPGSSQPLAAADGARSRKRSVVTRADAPSVEVPRAVRHGGCPLPNDGPQLVVIKVLEAATLAARCGYVLRR